MRASNPCLNVRAVHMHCELPTVFGVQMVGDRRLGKREMVERALSKLRALGHAASSFSHQDIGKLTLNVTQGCQSPDGTGRCCAITDVTHR